MQPFRGAAEVQFLGHGEERPDLADVHDVPLADYSAHGNTQGWIRYWTVTNLWGDSEWHVHRQSRFSPVASLPEVPDDVFADVLKQISVFVRTKVMPRELEIMATDAIPDDLRTQAAEMGLFGYAIPQEWGGLGLDLVQDVEVAMELGYTSLSLRSMFGTNNGIAGQVLVGFGTDEQKAQWLPGIATGDVVASFALTEPGAGSNPAGLQDHGQARR